MRSPIVGRVVMLLVLLALPLSLAVASQALASRPGAPAIEDSPIRLPGVTTTGGGTSPGADPTAEPDPTTDGPRIVRPEVPPASGDDDEDDDRDDGDDDGDD